MILFMMSKKTLDLLKSGFDFSTDKGSLPNDVWACLQSRAVWRAVRPIKLIIKTL